MISHAAEYTNSRKQLSFGIQYHRTAIVLHQASTWPDQKVKVEKEKAAKEKARKVKARAKDDLILAQANGPHQLTNPSLEPRQMGPRIGHHVRTSTTAHATNSGAHLYTIYRLTSGVNHFEQLGVLHLPSGSRKD